MKKLKRVVIKEELVILTNDFRKAIVLGQMIYWSERVQDRDNYIQDEIRRAQMAMGNEERRRAELLLELNDELLSHGWIYKSAEDLSQETMMDVSKSTMGRYLNELVESGWLDRRRNPNWKGDNTFQYRVNLVKIQNDLHKLGLALEGYSLLSEDEIAVFQNDTSVSNYETPKSQNESSMSNFETSELSGVSNEFNDFAMSNFETPEFQNETGNFKMKQVISKRNNVTRDYYRDYFRDYNNNNNNRDDEAVVVDEKIREELKDKIELVTGNSLCYKTLDAFLKKPQGEEKLRRAVKNYAAISRVILKTRNIDNPIGLLFYIAENDIEPPKSEKAAESTGSGKQLSFNSFSQHEYTEQELQQLYEKF